MPTAIHWAPRSPSAARITAEAGVWVAASPVGARHAEADEVDGEVERDYSKDAGDQAAGEFAAGVAHFAGHEGGGLPAAVGEGDGDHGGADGAGQAEGDGAIEQRQRMDCATAQPEAEHDHRCDRGGFQQHEQALHVAAGAGA